MLQGAWGELAGLRYVRVDPEGREAEALPLIIAIHGRGADASDLAPLAGELEPGAYRWILPQGPREVPLGPGYTGWAWYDLGERQRDTVVESRDRLTSFVAAVLDQFGLLKDQVLVTGFSQGGVMTLQVGLTSPDPFAGLAVMSGYIPASETLQPVLPERQDRSVLMVHGVYDQVLEIDRARQAKALLEGAGLRPEYHEFPMDHEITAASLAVVREYLRRRLPAGVAADS